MRFQAYDIGNLLWTDERTMNLTAVYFFLMIIISLIEPSLLVIFRCMIEFLSSRLSSEIGFRRIPWGRQLKHADRRIASHLGLGQLAWFTNRLSIHLVVRPKRSVQKVRSKWTFDHPLCGCHATTMFEARVQGGQFNHPLNECSKRAAERWPTALNHDGCKGPFTWMTHQTQTSKMLCRLRAHAC